MEEVVKTKGKWKSIKTKGEWKRWEDEREVEEAGKTKGK